MDKRIEKLPNTDEATKVILQELVEKKEKLDKAESDYRFHAFLSFGLAIMLLFSLYKTVHMLDIIEYSSIQLLFSTNYFNLAVLIFLILDFCWLKIIKSKHLKLETEFHQLRVETVDKSKDLWRSDEAWIGRKLVYEVLKEEFDINLFYESK